MRTGEASNRNGAARLAIIGMLANVLLAIVKLVAGLVGHAYALVADAVESLADIIGSAVIWGGLRVAALPPSERHPYGYGKAEPLAGLAVACIIASAGIGIAVKAVNEIITPHHAPAPFTLGVLLGVIVVKEVLFRVVRRAAKRTGSNAVAADAVHHRADAITSVAAGIGIGVALIGGPGWEPADDWAALVAAAIIIWNAWSIAKPSLRELLDAQAPAVSMEAARVAAGVAGVRRVEKSRARKSGMGEWIDMHVWVDPAMSVRAAHGVAHAVKDAVKAALPTVRDVLIHVEPDADPHPGAGSDISVDRSTPRADQRP
ncbi:MAG: cation transporter [Planctomycetes bacterium]|nr:cation transporter [Planctomycetota bacterium]